MIVKKISLVLASLFLTLLVLSACSHNGSNTSLNSTTTTATTETTTETTTATTIPELQNINPDDCTPNSRTGTSLSLQQIEQQIQDSDLLQRLSEMRDVELLAAYTTCYEAGMNRVKNIERIADLTRGVVISPKMTFSLNAHIGQRTIAKGFVIGDALSTTEGLFPSVGGGISQFTTALFNAAFFAGLDIPKSQPHTFHFERYPYGREATINWGEIGSPSRIDLDIRNNTSSDILIWTSYTPSSTTVLLYGKPLLLEVLELPRIETPQNNCTKVEIKRKRTQQDNTETIDAFNALYQSKQGEPCD